MAFYRNEYVTLIKFIIQTYEKYSKTYLECHWMHSARHHSIFNDYLNPLMLYIPQHMSPEEKMQVTDYRKPYINSYHDYIFVSLGEVFILKQVGNVL
jgi:hypothetical protein